MTEAEKASHTQEPWTVAEETFDNHGIQESVIRGMGGRAAIAVTLDFGKNNPDMRDANARRIVACVNACFDMDDDEIEQIMAESKGIGMLLSQKEYAISELNRLIAETVQQREELLAALERIEKYGHGIGHRSGYTCANIAEEAIAKARGKS